MFRVFLFYRFHGLHWCIAFRIARFLHADENLVIRAASAFIPLSRIQRFNPVGCSFAGLCYSEFSTMILIAGSAYTYSYATSGYATSGELLAWIIGWDLVLEYAVGAATVSIGWSSTFVALLQQLNEQESTLTK